MTHPHVTFVAVAFTLMLVQATACRREEPAAVAASPTAAATNHVEAHEHAHNQQPTAAHPDEHMEHAEHLGHALPLDAPLSGTSVYHVDAKFTDQYGKAFDFAALRGSTVLMTMFYASCKSICPVLITQLKRVDEKLAPEVRERTQVVLISLDPARDSTSKLQELAALHGIRDARWHFLRASEDDVREIAAVLGVRYRRLPDGELSHSPLLALLDREGVIVSRAEPTPAEVDALIAATTSAANKRD